VPISGLVVTFESSALDHAGAIEQLRSIPEIEIGESSKGKLAIVVDSADKERDQEIWNTVRDLPGVIDLAVAMVAFDEDSETGKLTQMRRDEESQRDSAE